MSTHSCPVCSAQVEVEQIEAFAFIMTACMQCGTGLKSQPSDSIPDAVDLNSSVTEDASEQTASEPAAAVEEPEPEDAIVETAHADDSINDESLAESSVIDESINDDGSLAETSVVDESLLGVSASEAVDVSSDISIAMPAHEIEESLADGTELEDVSTRTEAQQAQIFATSTSPDLLDALRGHLGDAKWARGLKTNICGGDTIEVLTRCFLGGGRVQLLLIQQNLEDINGLELCYAFRAIEAAFGMDKAAPILLFGEADQKEGIQDALLELNQTKFVPMKSTATEEQNAERMATIVQRLVKAASRSK